jgi:cytochrome c oxidase assembly factor CtaG
VSPDASWSLSPGPLVLLTAATVVYVARWRQSETSAWRLALFVAGIASMVAALISPIDRLADQIMLMHMVQHVLLLDVAPILVILGLTKVLLRPATRRLMAVERAVGPLGHPAFAVVLYAGTMWAWHIPALYGAAVESPAVHVLEHLMMSTAGFLYWWHVLSPIRSRHRLSGLGPIAYMGSTRIVLGLLGVVLTFAPESFYAVYEDQPRYWGLSAQDDQALAGVVMATVQSIVMGVALVWLFIRLLGESERDEQRAERYAPS